MDQIKKNTVPAQGQVRFDDRIIFENQHGIGTRFLFVGNSITMHGLKQDIGWYGDNYGMAASAKEKDYVHLIMKKILQEDSEAAFCIFQAAKWEMEYQAGRDNLYSDPVAKMAREFAADVIIMRVIENCRVEGFNSIVFEEEYKALIDYLNVTGKATVILSTSFFKHPGDNAIAQIGAERGYPVAYLGDLGEEDKMKALGKFEHGGVANHPGDEGMRCIAERIIALL